MFIYINIDSLFPVLSNELQSIIITSYFHVEIVPDLAYGNPFKLVSVPSGHAHSLNTYLLSGVRYPGLFYTLPWN